MADEVRSWTSVWPSLRLYSGLFGSFPVVENKGIDNEPGIGSENVPRGRLFSLLFLLIIFLKCA